MLITNNFEYGYILNNSSFLNAFNFNKLYLPILGEKTSKLFTAMFYESLKQKENYLSINKIHDLLDSQNATLDDFNSSRVQLEALNLLKTFFDKEQRIVYFEIVEPLDIKSFLSNEKFSELLLKKIGRANFSFLKNNIHSEISECNSLNDISSSFDDVFNIVEKSAFNKQDLLDHFKTITNLNINIDKTSCNIIEEYIQNQKLNNAQIATAIIKSISQLENKTFFFSAPTLKINLINLFEADESTDFCNVNRDKKIFLNKQPAETLVAIFNDYSKLSNKEYLESINKSKLTEVELKILKSLKKITNFPDAILNMMIDFSLFKTNGKLNEKYLTKMIKTFNGLNINSLEDGYDYLVFSFSEEKAISEPKVKQTPSKRSYKKSYTAKNDFELSEDENFVSVSKTDSDDEIVLCEW